MRTSKINLTIITALTLLTACGKSTSSSSGSVGGAAATTSQGVSSIAGYGYTCTFTEFDEVTISQDPTQDFSVTGGTFAQPIQNNTCTGVSNGVIETETLSSVTRSSSLITISDSTGSDTLTISNNQATIPQSDLALCASGVQGTGTLSEVDLDPTSDTIRLYINWNMVINGCTQASTSSGQSAPAPVVTEALHQNEGHDRFC